MSQTGTTDHRLGFTSLEEETAVDSLPVTGHLPSWLSGALVRVTPAKLGWASGASTTGSTASRC